MWGTSRGSPEDTIEVRDEPWLSNRHGWDGGTSGCAPEGTVGVRNKCSGTSGCQCSKKGDKL